MARGRQPWKYKTQQERDDARREHVRLNVRALRQRRRQAEDARRALHFVGMGPLKVPPESEGKTFEPVVHIHGIKRRKLVEKTSRDAEFVETKDEPEEVEELLTNPTRFNDTVALYQRAGRLRSPGELDIEKHSEYAAIDLQFDALSAVVHHFQAIATDKLPWSSALADNRGKEDRLVEIAISSAGTQYIGFMKNDRKLLEWSNSAYRKSCTSLRTRFEKPKWQSQAPSLCMVTLALSMIYMLIGYLENNNDPREWTKHYQACNSIMNEAGIAAFQSELGMTVMRGCRAGIIFVDITRGQGCFLDSADWRRLPLLTEIMRPRSPFTKAQDAFWDLASRVTSMLARANQLMSILHHSPYSPSVRQDATILATDMSLLRQEFKAWLFRVEIDVGERLYSEEIAGGHAHLSQSQSQSQSPPQSQSPSQTQPPLHDEYIFLSQRILNFRDLHTAELITSYWTYSFYLWDISGVYHHTLASLPQPLLPPLDDDFQPQQAHYFASMICQCIWWYMSRKVPTSTVLLYVSFPLRVATQYWARDVRRSRREWEWAANAAEKVRESGMAGALAECFVSGFLPPPVYR